MNFRPVTLQDKSDIERCLINNTYQSCDFCFVNIFAWANRFLTEFDIQNNTLFLRCKEHDGKTYYMMPIGKMEIKKAFDLIISNSLDYEVPFRMKGISYVMWREIEQAMPGKFKFTHTRENDEYIYLTQTLISLQGKKLQSKRNHINRFNKENPNWEYLPITHPQEVNACIEMLQQWKEQPNIEKNKTLEYDYQATRTMLQHFFELNLVGGMIVLRGKIIAFSLGEGINQDTFVVHVEKAFNHLNGAYTIINQQFAEHAAKSYKYINREEDMGLDNLRKAKLSYQPIYLLQEGNVSFL